MSLIGRTFLPRTRADTTLRDPAAWLVEGFGNTTQSGERVNDSKAMTLSVYYACLRNISEDVGKLPLKVVEELKPRGKKPLPDHPLYEMLRRTPNPLMSSMAWREVMTHWAMGWGGGLSEIERDQGGNPVAFWPIHPSRVEIKWLGGHDLRYVVHQGDRPGDPSEVVSLEPENVIHLRGLSKDGVDGYSVLQMGAESLGLTIAAQTFGAAFFGNKTALGGQLTTPQKLNPVARKNIMDSFKLDHGGARKAGSTPVLEQGLEYKSIGIPPDQAQFLQTRMFQIEEVCRWFRVSPHKVQHLLRAHFNNVEHLGIEYVTDALGAWVERWEQELDRKLLPDPDVVVEHTVQALLRGDSAARSTFYGKLFQVGAFSPNDIRELEGGNPMEGGDDYYVPANMVKVDAEPPAPSPPPTFPPQAEDEEETDAREMTKKAYARVIAQTATALLTKESHHIKRNHRKAGFDDRLRAFYEKHGDTVSEALAPLLQSFAEILTGSPLSSEASGHVRALAAVYAREHCEESLMVLGAEDAAGLCDLWLIERPGQIAQDLTEKAAMLADSLAHTNGVAA